MSPREWLTTAQAAVLLECTPHHVGYLARTGVLRSKMQGRNLLVEAAAVQARVVDAAQWVSYLGAAEVVGCGQTTITRAVRRGDIERRLTTNRAQPALRRESVERFAIQWRSAQREQRRRRAVRESRRFGPPDSEYVWLSPGVTALMLGVSRSRLRQLAREERVPFTMSSGRRWYRRDHVEIAAASRSVMRLAQQF
ncbi:hypothetical protein [Nocardioides sp.]|uniref:hypothetical protein n=1 Tax=Nocardioides sp. TaxID=35761 RepID=UPI0027362FBF|nr:hypothetical protein [Nocardioides sp.]MDP3890499.1 hypothetical protein [Nocardioides sp.]